MMIFKKQQNGSVSLFVVIFATLLISVVTVGFIKIMINDQQQASAADLSQSAYDSAQAGVEDAKRAIAQFQISGAPNMDKWATDCNASVGNLADINSNQNFVASGEVKVQNGNNTNLLDQAYTCVKVNLNTDDYLGVLGPDENKLIPLSGADSFNTIKLEWFTQKDLQGSGSTVNVPVVAPGPNIKLPPTTDWITASEPNRPSLMRAQLIQIDGATFSFSGVDDSKDVNAFNNTLFLYPSNSVNTSSDFRLDAHRTLTTVNPVTIHCNSDLSGGGYACAATLRLPRTVPVGGKAYLNLASIYKKSSYRITLLDSEDLNKKVQFNAVQPEIDSTGRANDLFRRVVSRVELTNTTSPYPVAAVDITNNFCKTFRVTNDAAAGKGYDPGTCDPGANN